MPQWLELGKVTLASIMQAAVLVVAFIVGYVKLDSTVVHQQEAVVEIREEARRQNTEWERRSGLLRTELDKINDKRDSILDRLATSQQLLSEKVVRVETKLDLLIEKANQIKSQGDQNAPGSSGGRRR